MFSKPDISKFSRTRVNGNGDILFYSLLLITYTNSLDPESEVIKLFFMLNIAEHKIYQGLKC